MEVETQRASPFASSLLFDYVATYMYEGDTPNAERRAAALSLDRDLLRELLGQEELRELIDPDALAEVEADLQRTSERTRAANADGLHDVLRALGDLTADEAQARCLPAVAAARILERAREGAARGADADRRRGALDRVRGRRPLPRRPRRRAARRPARRVPRGGRGAARSGSPAATPARTVRSPRASCRNATALDLGPVLRELERAGDLVRGELRPGGSEREWCDPDVLRRLRRASLATLRKEVEPAEQRALARFLPDVAGRGRSAAGRRRRRPPARDARAAAGPGARARGMGARRAAAARGRVLAGVDGPALRERRARVGWRRGRSAAAQGAWRSTSARTRAGSARRPSRASGLEGPLHDAIRERLERGAAFWTDLLAGPPRDRAGGAAGGALGSRLGRRGHERRIRPAARAAAVGGEGRPRTPGGASPAGAGRARRRCRAAGRSPRRCSPARPRTARACARSRSCCSSATGS